MHWVEEISILNHQKDVLQTALKNVCAERDAYLAEIIKCRKTDAGLSLFLGALADTIDDWFPDDDNPRVQEDLRTLAGVFRDEAGEELIAEVAAMLEA